jgi:hypothetical protein
LQGDDDILGFPNGLHIFGAARWAGVCEILPTARS